MYQTQQKNKHSEKKCEEFSTLPKDLVNIISGYIDDLEMVDLYFNFYEQYNYLIIKTSITNLPDKIYKIFNLVKNTKKEQEELILSIPQSLSNLYKNSVSVDFSMQMFDDGPRLNGELGEYSDPNSLTEIFDRDPDRYEIPEDLKLFYILFSQSKKNNPSGILQPMTKLEGFDGFDCIVWDSDNPHFEKDVYIKDWFGIFIDNNSVDNGRGCLYINLNPDSPEFNHVYSYSSSDEGHTAFVADSFRGVIEELVENVSCFSICDHLGKRYCTCDK